MSISHINSQGWPHLFIDAVGCDKKALFDRSLIESFLMDLPNQIEMERLDTKVYFVDEKTHPDVGITGVSIITTSHISIHTFPNGQDGFTSEPFFTFDCYSCKPFDKGIIEDYIQKTFNPKKLHTKLHYRLTEL